METLLVYGIMRRSKQEVRASRTLSCVINMWSWIDATMHRHRWSHAGETPQRSAKRSGSFRRTSDALSKGDRAAPSRADSLNTPRRVIPNSPTSPDAASRASSNRRFRPRADGAMPESPPVASGSFRYDSAGVTWSGDELTSPSEARRPSPHRRSLASIFRTASWQSISSAGSGET